MKSTLKFTVLLFLIIGINACRSQRISSDPERISGAEIHTACYSIENFYVPSCRFEISTGNQSLSLNGSIYINPDSVCFFRGRLLIEVVRGAIYRDSFIVINYLERTCYTGKNEYLQRLTGFPVNPELLLRIFTADRCSENIALNRNYQHFSVNYDGYSEFEQFDLPTVLDISATDGRTSISIKANFQQVLLNQPQEVNISIPASYRIIVLE